MLFHRPTLHLVGAVVQSMPRPHGRNAVAGVVFSRISGKSAWLLIALSTETDRLPLRVRIHSLAIHYTINVAEIDKLVAGKNLLSILERGVRKRTKSQRVRASLYNKHAVAFPYGRRYRSQPSMAREEQALPLAHLTVNFKQSKLGSIRLALMGADKVLPLFEPFHILRRYPLERVFYQIMITVTC